MIIQHVSEDAALRHPRHEVRSTLIPFWSGHGDREPLGETVCVVSGVVTS